MLAVRERGKHVIPNCEKNAAQFNEGEEKFFNEAELVRQFNGNPNIVIIYECFYANNTAYFIMEYLNGIMPENYVKAHGVLIENQAAYISDKLTMALAILHSGGVLHRDISLDNLMLCKDKTVKLIDFGAARQCVYNGTRGYTAIFFFRESVVRGEAQNELRSRKRVYLANLKKIPAKRGFSDC